MEMIIKLSPQRRDDDLSLSKSGDVLTINGEVFDFSVVPNGAALPRDAITCEFIAGDVERDEAGVLTVPLIIPLSANPTPEQAFPADIVSPADGEVVLP